MPFPPGFNCGGVIPSFRVGSGVAVTSGVLSVSGLPAGVSFPGIYGADSISGTPDPGTQGFVSGKCNGLDWLGLCPEATAHNTYGWNPDNGLCQLVVGVSSTFAMTGYFLTTTFPFVKVPIALAFALYNDTFTACPPVGDAMPAGLTLQSDGSITGTLVAAGISNIQVVAWGADYGNVSGGLQIQITDPNPPDLAGDCASPAAGLVGLPYSHTFGATGGVPPYVFAALGGLPPGLSVDSAGVLSGTPTTAGVYNAISLTVTDSDLTVAPFTCSVTITAGTPAPIIPAQHIPVVGLPNPLLNCN